MCPLLSARSFACQLARKCNDVDWRRSLRDDIGVFMYVCVYVCKCLSRNVLEQKVAFSLITCGLSTTIQQMIITLVKHNQHDVYTHTTTCKCVCIAVISAAWAFEFYHLCKQQQQWADYSSLLHYMHTQCTCIGAHCVVCVLHSPFLNCIQCYFGTHPGRRPSKLTWESGTTRERRRESTRQRAGERVSGMFAFASTIVRWSRVSQLLSSAAWSQLWAVCVEQLSLPLPFAVSVCC